MSVVVQSLRVDVTAATKGHGVEREQEESRYVHFVIYQSDLSN